MQLNAGSRKRAALDEGHRECNIWASIRLPTPSILGAEWYRCQERLHIILVCFRNGKGLFYQV